jgi:hypothetical protein
MYLSILMTQVNKYHFAPINQSLSETLKDVLLSMIYFSCILFEINYGLNGPLWLLLEPDNIYNTVCTVKQISSSKQNSKQLLGFSILGFHILSLTSNLGFQDSAAHMLKLFQ